jgi:hypothetical protein
MDYKEKNKAFLAYFWDLASDEAEKRLCASNGILEHVADSLKTQKGMNEEGTMTIDLDYTVKRLVRGLSSSRDSARHGFATCLSKLLSTKCIGAAAVLEIMEESTKVRNINCNILLLHTRQQTNNHNHPLTSLSSFSHIIRSRAR